MIFLTIGSDDIIFRVVDLVFYLSPETGLWRWTLGKNMIEKRQNHACGWFYIDQNVILVVAQGEGDTTGTAVEFFNLSYSNSKWIQGEVIVLEESMIPRFPYSFDFT